MWTNERMWFMQFHVVILGFVHLLRQGSISLIGEANFREMLKLEIQEMVSFVTYRAPSTLRILYVKNNACLLGVKLIGGALGEILKFS